MEFNEIRDFNLQALLDEMAVEIKRRKSGEKKKPLSYSGKRRQRMKEQNPEEYKKYLQTVRDYKRRTSANGKTT